MPFVGREEEIKIIKRELSLPKYRGVLLYGRRRVGKSELIAHCLKDESPARVISFVGTRSDYFTNLSLLINSLSFAYKLPLSFDSVEDALSFVFESSKKERTILVMDEFSYLRDSYPSIDSVLQKLIDSNQKESDLKLIVSGSLITIMMHLIDKDAPLYGRFHAIIHLLPLDYLDAAKMLPNRSNEERVFLYSIFGGVPFYLSLIDEKESGEEALLRLVFSRNSVLEGEVDLLLQGEISKMENAVRVFSFLKSGSKSYKDINAFLSNGKSGNSATYILDKLTSAGLLEKEVAINQKEKRNALYRIADPFLRFYYAYVVPNRSTFLIASPKMVYEECFKEEILSKYIPQSFQNICKEFLIRENRLGKFKPLFLEFGSLALTYKDKDSGEIYSGEFDVVGRNKLGYVDFECKYLSSPIDDNVIDDERACAKKLGDPFVDFAFFSKEGYSGKGTQYKVYSLSDIYAGLDR